MFVCIGIPNDRCIGWLARHNAISTSATIQNQDEPKKVGKCRWQQHTFYFRWIYTNYLFKLIPNQQQQQPFVPTLSSCVVKMQLRPQITPENSVLHNSIFTNNFYTKFHNMSFLSLLAKSCSFLFFKDRLSFSRHHSFLCFVFVINWKIVYVSSFALCRMESML